MRSGELLHLSVVRNLTMCSALASLEDRDQVAGSPPSSQTSPVLTKTQPAQPTVERQPSKSGPRDGEEAS